jgi:anti-sigma-K factor RskA
MNTTTPQEYVLGLLDQAEDAAFEHRLKSQATQQKETAEWSLMIAQAIASNTDARTPPQWLWTRIERQITAQAQAAEAARQFSWHMVAALLAMVGLVVAISLTVPKTLPFSGQHEAVLALNETGAPAWQVQGNFKDNELNVVVTRSGQVAAGRTPVLWLATAGGQTIAVGRLPTQVGQTLRVSPALWQGDMQAVKLAISLEPAHAIIGNKPQGPVVLVSAWQPRPAAS